MKTIYSVIALLLLVTFDCCYADPMEIAITNNSRTPVSVYINGKRLSSIPKGPATMESFWTNYNFGEGVYFTRNNGMYHTKKLACQWAVLNAKNPALLVTLHIEITSANQCLLNFNKEEI